MHMRRISFRNYERNIFSRALHGFKIAVQNRGLSVPFQSRDFTTTKNATVYH